MSYRCAKCGHAKCEVGAMRASGGPLASMFDLENKRFTTVACASCGFTEFYRASRTTVLGMVGDGLIS